jgi:HSP20 family molecular chaperone IbpA
LAEKEKKHVPVRRAGKEERAIVPRRPEDYLSSMDRAFQDFESRFFERMMGQYPGGGGWFAPWRRRWLAELPEVRHPYADLIDSGKEYRVMAEVPGIPKEKLDITVTDREIKIEGEAKTDLHEEKEGFVRRERGYSRISRSVTFPEPVIADKAEASLNNGILEVKVPKKSPTEVSKHKVVVK